MSQGRIKSIIDSVYPLEQAAEAHTKMLKGKGLFGKILLKPWCDLLTNPKIDSILDEANRLFLKGKPKEAITYYDKILDEYPNHLSSLNNKGYALSKLKDYDGAIRCYDKALEIDSTDLSILVNKISCLRKKGIFDEALSYCDKILAKNQNYKIALYHKERILFSLNKFEESLVCCNTILDDYPNNGDVLYDKSCNLVMLLRIDEGLDCLERAIQQGIQFKVKAKKSKTFETLSNNQIFQQLVL